MKIPRTFASDNFAGVHPEILEALEKANYGHAAAYGNDPWTARAIKKFQEHFGKNIEVFFVFNGTGANVLSLKALTNPFNAIFCADRSHINVDECGAPENFTGCKLIPIQTQNGKITPDQIKLHLHSIGDQHHVQPQVISIAQATELGTVYQPAEIKKLSDFAHKNNMFVHMDGARIANAAVHLNLPFKKFTADCGIDVLSFGGTKNGMMFGEAVIFFNKKLAENFKYIRKQGMQLCSKMRFIAAQFEVLLSNDLWKKNAVHANKMAELLAHELKKIPKIKLTQSASANGIFATIPAKYISKMQKISFFYVWDEAKSEIRLMTSFDTTESDIKNFAEKVKHIITRP